MASATDFRTSDETTNSLFKGFTRSKPTSTDEPSAKPPSNIRNSANTGRQNAVVNDWNGLTDEQKLSKALVAQNYDGRQEPKQWAYQFIQQNPEYTDIELNLRSDAHEAYIKGLNDVWWGSAARDWNLELFRGGNAGHMFKPSPSLVSGVQSGPRMW